MKGFRDHSDAPTVALIIRHAERLPEALQSLNQLCAAHHRVLLYLLEPATRSLGVEAVESLTAAIRMSADSRSNHRPTARRLGLTYAAFEDMAGVLEKTRWILTF